MATNLAHMDAASQALVLQLWAGDVDGQRNKGKGKRRADAIDDYRSALDLIEADINAYATTLMDGVMAQSIARAVHEDRGAIGAAQTQEKQAADDRQAALQLHRSGRIDPPPARDGSDPPPPYQGGADDGDFFDKLEARYNIAPEVDAEDATPQAESSSKAASRPIAKPRRTRPVAKAQACVVCDDHLPSHELARLPCSHEYCRACLTRLFTDSLTDEALWPPRCCRQRIPAEQDQIRIFLSGQLMGRYLARKLEMETPHRVYCHKPDCSMFIPPPGIANDTGTCPKCDAKTCVICKGAAHDGCDCPDDEAGRQLMALASKEGWKQCFSCHRIVELSYGCNHTTCRCGAEFCYKCGATWNPRTCECELFDEDALLQRAAEIEGRDPHFQRQPEVRQAEMLQQRVDHLVRNHECRHTQWRHKGGPAGCEECGKTMPRWINVCRLCDLMICSRCKLNRL